MDNARTLRRRPRYQLSWPHATKLSREPLSLLVINGPQAEPVLTPESPEELRGTISNVVFPTGIDRRDDLGTPDRFDIYFGIADNRVGAARLDVPEWLPPGAPTRPELRAHCRSDA